MADLVTTTRLAHPFATLVLASPPSKGEEMAKSLKWYAHRQLGCFTHDQALAAGYPQRTIVGLRAKGTWEALQPNVYRVAAAGPVTFHQRLVALALSVDGLAFGSSATSLYGLSSPPRQPEVIVVRADRNRFRPGVHSTRFLADNERTKVGVIPATSPSRAVIDASSTLNEKAVIELVDRAVLRKRVRPLALEKRARELRNSKRPGASRVLAALASQHPEMAKARNDWEARVLRLVAQAGLPLPTPNLAVVVDGQLRLLDVAWGDFMIDLEFDGFDPHMVRDVFDDDRVRQNALVAAGWTVLRVTSRMLEQDPGGLVAKIASLMTRGHENGQMRLIS